MIGDRLGKWVIFKELGRGGMGRVYLAQEELTARQAAIKVLSTELAQEIGFLHRFQREIETLSKLEHPNIVRFYEAGFENGLYYYAMEYVDGLNLDQILEEQTRLLWKDVLNIALQVAPALKHVHDHGVIHRDIKPSNLILNAQGQIKLTDFGIAKVFAATHLTATGGIVGTAEFLSPEQAAGKVVGKRSDLYCLGCVLYMLLTGRPPFTGNTYVELLHKHRYGQFDRPQKFVPELPLEIDEVVCQLLEKDPDKRPADAMVLFKQLDSIATKLARQAHATSANNRDTATQAENRADKVSMEALPGPATLISRLVRAELDEQQHGGAVTRFFNRPVVLVLILLACVGILTWKFWPASQEDLFQGGEKLMQTGSLYDMERAWADYLGPLESRYPDHPYPKQVAEFRAKWENAKQEDLFRGGEKLMQSNRLADMERAWAEYLGPLEGRYPEHPYKDQVAEFRTKWENAKALRPSEAQRFFQQGELLQKQGNPAAAQKTWTSLIDAFSDVDAEKEWVRKARSALHDLDRVGKQKDRWQSVHKAIERARELRMQEKTDDAERILAGIEELYRNDPSAHEILNDVRRARQK